MSMILSDDDIADILKDPIEHLFWATELLRRPNGTKTDLNDILISHYIIIDTIHDLIQLVKKLRINGNVYKTRHDYMRLLQREREYMEDEKYFQSIKEKKEGVATESSQETSNTNHQKT